MTYFPKYFSKLAIGTYFLSLVVVSFLFMQYAMHWYWILIGATEIVAFFMLSNHLSKAWQDISDKTFTKRLFWWSLGLRLAFMTFFYWFHTYMTGQPFQFGAADTMFYHSLAQYGHTQISDGNFAFLSTFERYAGLALSDTGYPIWLSFMYWLFDDSIFMSRVVKCLLGAWMCLLIYKVTKRNFGDKVARMAAIFTMLMPNFWYYCSSGLKECEMTFLTVAFIERADYIIRTRKFMGMQFVLTIALGISLFFFRTVLGAAAIMSFGLALLITSRRAARISQRWIMLIAMVLIGSYFVGGRIAMEVEAIWEMREENQSGSMEWRSEREGGNVLARNANAVVFAPMIFTIPFPTYVETEGQENQRMMHGANFIKNIISCLCLFGLFMMVFKDGELRGFMKGPWREHVLLMAMLLGYLVVITFSAFAQSERFHMPALPFEMIFAAVGLSYVETKKHKKLYLLWCGLMFVAAIGWSWFKLRGRGLV